MKFKFQNKTGGLITLRASKTKKSSDFVSDEDTVSFQPGDNIYEFPANKQYLVIRLFGTNQPGLDTIGCIIPCPFDGEFNAVIGYATPDADIIIGGVEYGIGSTIEVPEINTFAIGMGKYELQIDGKAKAIISPCYYRPRSVSNGPPYEVEIVKIEDIKIFMGTQTKLERKDVLQLYITIIIIALICIAIIVITVVEKSKEDGDQ